MKATYVFLLTMSWAMVQHGTGYAAFLRVEPALETLPRGEGVARPAFSSAGAGRVGGRSGPAPEKVSRPKQFPNRQLRSTVGNTPEFPQRGSGQSGAAAKNGSLRNETVNNALAVRGPSVVRPTTPSFGNVRHRGPNPAVVNGAPRAHGRNTAAINGTRMTRRP